MDQATFGERLLHERGGYAAWTPMIRIPGKSLSGQGRFRRSGLRRQAGSDRIHALGRIPAGTLADRALPGDDRGVPEGVDEEEAFLLGDLRASRRRRLPCAVQDDFSAVIPGGGTLISGVPWGMMILALMPKRRRDRRRPGHGSCRGGDDPRARSGRERLRSCQGAALFERTGDLEVSSLKRV